MKGKKVYAYGLKLDAQACPTCSATMHIACMMGECFAICEDAACGTVGQAPTEHALAPLNRAKLAANGWIRRRFPPGSRSRDRGT